MKFEELVDLLKQNGFNVEVKKDKLYDFASVTGGNIRGGFCSPHNPNDINASYSYLNGKIAVDHEECFDKWSKCPLVLPFPITKDQKEYLLAQLKFWGTEENFDLSNGYDIDKWVGEYPAELQVEQ